MRAHARYSGGYSPDSATVKAFWKVRRMLLKDAACHFGVHGWTRPHVWQLLSHLASQPSKTADGDRIVGFQLQSAASA